MTSGDLDIQHKVIEYILYITEWSIAHVDKLNSFGGACWITDINTYMNTYIHAINIIDICIYICVCINMWI